MGNKTVTRLAILAVAVAILGGGGYVLWAFQVDRMAHGIVARADRAAGEGKYAEAERLYADHLANKPNDVEAQLKLAEVLLKQEKSSQRYNQAMGIFDSVVNQYPARDDVRRRAAELAEEMGLSQKARDYLLILEKVPSLEDDGHLEYLMGRCRERLEEFDTAARYYRDAIEHGAPERIEAVAATGDAAPRPRSSTRGPKPARPRPTRSSTRWSSRRRGITGSTWRGGGIATASRRAGPGTTSTRRWNWPPRVVPRSTWRWPAPGARRRTRPGPGHAGAAEKGFDAARKILEQGLEAAPKSPELYMSLAELERRAGRVEEAIKAMELGMKALPEDLNLRFSLALFLASRGEAESGRLLLQTAELERLGVSALLTRYLTAYYHYNKREFARAKEMLGSLQTDMGRLASPDLKAKINLLLAQCHAALGEDAEQQEAMLRAYSANQNDTMTRMGWIEALMKRGDLDTALREYQSLVADAPGVARLPLAPTLAGLLMARARRLETSGRWDAADEADRGPEEGQAPGR